MSVRRNRAILKRVFLDEVEDNLLKLNMKKFGMIKFSNYARRMLLYPQLPVINIDTSEYEKMTDELKRIGNNLNQVAKLANQNKQVDAQAISQMENLIQELRVEMSRELKLKIEEVKSEYGGY